LQIIALEIVSGMVRFLQPMLKALPVIEFEVIPKIAVREKLVDEL
jgi:hypothetical protein